MARRRSAAATGSTSRFAATYCQKATTWPPCRCGPGSSRRDGGPSGAAAGAACDVAGSQVPKRDARHLAMHLLPGRRDQREAGDDLVRSPGQTLEHLLGFLRADGLAVDTPGANDLGVAAENGTPVGFCEHRPR